MYKLAADVFAIVTVVTLATSPIGARGIAQDNLQPMTVRGEVWDSTCAAAGSHGQVMAKTQAKNVKQCTLDCIKAGAELVLFNQDDKTVYRLDSQDKVKEYAGQTVTVIGNYDRATNILHVDRIETVM